MPTNVHCISALREKIKQQQKPNNKQTKKEVETKHKATLE